MRDMPTNQLDPRVKNVWRINDGFWITVVALCFVGTALLMRLDPEAAAVADVVLAVTGAAYIAALIVWLAVLPPIRYYRWRYELSEEYLDIAKGIIWRKRYIIPFIRVQNTDTRQGPILRLFHLASVTVETAAGGHESPGLKMEVADVVRDKAAELARLAREDV